MRQWLFEKKDIRNSPSFKDDIDPETEDRYRREGVRFLMDIGAELKLSPHPTLATAAVYFHRFYMYHSFKEFSRHLTALGCLFLAGKTEETPKKCRDIVQLAKDKLSEKHWYQAFGRDKDPKEEVMSVERVLLQTIKFDLQVEHPYTFLLKYARLLRIDKEKARSVVQMAWTFVNDSLCTNLCLQWEPEIIAIALMYLASRLSKVDISDWYGKRGERGEKWWDQVVENMSMNLLEDICHQVLDLYSSSSGKVPAAAPPPATSSPATAPTSTPSSSSTPSRISPFPGNQNVPATVSRPPVPQMPAHQGPPVLGSVAPMTPTSTTNIPPPHRPLTPMSAGGFPPLMTGPNQHFGMPPGAIGYHPNSAPPQTTGSVPPFPPPHLQQMSVPPPGHNHRPPPMNPNTGYLVNFQHQNSFPRF